jgi:hypothetical protein
VRTYSQLTVHVNLPMMAWDEQTLYSCAGKWSVPFPFPPRTASSLHNFVVAIVMGVHGLATYLRENVRTLSTPLVLSQERSNSKPIIPLVVDGWSCVQLIDTMCNVIDNASEALYMNYTTDPVCLGCTVASLGSSGTL